MAMIAVIIPVWQHPALVDEALASCLAQENAPDFRIIVVNDGCDLAQTRQSLAGWAAAYPQQITLLTQRNQGLSAARNTGIEHALKDPDIEGIFFLDADNRLDPHALALFAKLLQSDSGAGWFYPQFDQFGIEANITNGGEWSLARLAVDNMCDAGSLVKRAVFAGGLRFDPAFKAGFEDWDFWLGAAKQGFFGAPVLQNFLRYRKRPESMLSSAQRQKQPLCAQIHAKHKWLFAGQNLPDIWRQEWPRFLLASTDGSFALGATPATAKPIKRADVFAEIYNNRANPAESRFPQVLVFSTPEAWQDLRAAKLLDSALYQLEGGLRQSPAVGLTLHKGTPDMRFGTRTNDVDGDILSGCDIIAMSLHHLNAALDNDAIEKIVPYLIDNVPVLPIQVCLPEITPPKNPPIETLMDMVGGLLLSPLLQEPVWQYRNWRAPSYPHIAWQVAENNAGARPVPAQLEPGKHVGFVTQVFSFGGVEKCLVALARELGKMGISCHLFIYGDNPPDAADWMFEPFTKVWILQNPALRGWSGARYLGTGTALPPGPELMGDMLGPLLQMDVVVNCGAGVLFNGHSSLRERGIKLVSWEHIIENSPYGRALGTPLGTVGYEAGLDLILTCSTHLGTVMSAHGVPRAKLLALPNGPGYEPTAIPPLRPPRAGKLRVGFLGRFDPQKQVERFIDVAIALRGQFEFSIVGGAVLGHAPIFPDWLQPVPPIKTKHALDAFYASIDVFLLPSKDEGLPLTILEAQRAGVVVLASDVGAVNEAVSNGETGILLPADKVVSAAIAALQMLDSNRPILEKIARNAAGKPDRWQQNAALFVENLL